jgi:hypothetical protein
MGSAVRPSRQEINMQAAKFEICPVMHNGQRAMRVAVINSMSNQELHAECERLGLKPTTDVSNSRSIVVTNQAELDAIRNPLRRFFQA